MKLEHSFTVPVGVDEAWKILLDIERIGPCMPGATIESVDGDDFTGSVKVKLGAINLTYKGKASFVEKDETAHRAVIDAKGRDSRGNGTAAAKVTAVLTDDAGSTKVVVETDLDVTGKVAQFGRGVMADVGNKLIGQFADCLATTITTDASAATAQLPAVGSSDQAAGGDAAPAKKTAAKAATTSTTKSTTKAAAKKARPKPSKSQPAAAAATDASEPSTGVTAPAEATAALPAQPVVEESALDAVAATPGYSAPAEEAAAPAAEAAPEPSVNGRSAASRREAEPINLLEHAGPAVAKRLAPPLVVALLVVLFVVLRRRRGA